METRMITESPRDPAAATERIKVDAGTYFSHHISAGQIIRIVDLEGNQAADTIFYSSENTEERYSAADTIREQRNVYLTTGSNLRSNRNRVMLTVIADTCGRHDTLGGACATESNTVRYDLEKRHMHACRDSWMLAIVERPELGLHKRDITHNINFFMNVPVSESGQLHFEDGISGRGKYVELEVKMDLIVLISNCPQLNNPCCGFNPTPIEILIWSH